MTTLGSVLAEAETQFRAMSKLGAQGGEGSSDEMIRLRSQYAMQMLAILQAVKTEPRLLEDRELKAEFDSRFFKVRQMLGEHQSKWRMEAIKADMQGYLHSAKALSSQQEDFYQWARGKFPNH